MSDDDDPRIDGKIIRGTFSTFTPKIKASKLRLLRYHETLGCFTKLALLPAIPFVVFVLLKWTIPAVLFGILTLAAAGFLIFAAVRVAEIAENAVLTASVVVSQSPIQILALANMSTWSADEPIPAIKLVQFSKIPCHSCTVGEVIPCVSGFLGEELDKWDDFCPEPLSFATGNMDALRANTDLLDSEDIALLKKHIAARSYPTEPGELRWLSEAEGSVSSVQAGNIATPDIVEAEAVAERPKPRHSYTADIVDTELVPEQPKARRPWWLLFGLMTILVLLFVWLGVRTISDAMQEKGEKAVNLIRRHPIVTEQLGGISECKFDVLASLNNDGGKGVDVFSVCGPKGSGELVVGESFFGIDSVVLRMPQGEWELLDQDDGSQ